MNWDVAEAIIVLVTFVAVFILLIAWLQSGINRDRQKASDKMSLLMQAAYAAKTEADLIAAYDLLHATREKGELYGEVQRICGLDGYLRGRLDAINSRRKFGSPIKSESLTAPQ